MPVIEFAYTKYRDMMVPMIPIKMKVKTAGLNFGPLLILELPILFLPPKKLKDSE